MPIPTALATATDLQARLGRALTAEENTKSTPYLQAATAAVCAYTRQHFSQQITTDLLRVVGGQVRLPQRPVNDVTAVVDIDGAALTWEWNAGDTVDVYTADGWVQVTYDHGYATIPVDVVDTVCDLALLRLANPNRMISETAGDWSGRWPESSGALSRLDHYRRGLTVVKLG